MKNETKTPQNFLFTKENYKIVIAGTIFIALGFILMAGGGSDDPNIFNEAMYSTVRIRIAPTLILIGLGAQVFAILYNPQKNK